MEVWDYEGPPWFGLRGHLPIFIANFLKDRSFKARVGSIFSESHPQEMGVPQGNFIFCEN